MDGNKLISVRNRNNGSTGYSIPDRNITRLWNVPGEIKNIPFAELQSLQYVPGGEYILENLLIVEDDEALNALNMHVEPEYKYTEEDIKNILLSVDNDSLDRLEDFLNFSPAGGIDLAQKLAVELEIPDTRKRKMISEKTGLNIDNAIMINHMMNDDDSEEEKAAAPKRKTTPLGEEKKSAAPVRKTTPKYVVTSMGK